MTATHHHFAELLQPFRATERERARAAWLAEQAAADAAFVRQRNSRGVPQSAQQAVADVRDGMAAMDGETISEPQTHESTNQQQ